MLIRHIKMTHYTPETNHTSTTDTNLHDAFMRLGCRPDYNATPSLNNEFETPDGKSVYAAEWGLDSNQDVSRAGTISHGPHKGSQWLIVADGHGHISTVPRWLRVIPDSYFDDCMSTDRPGVELEKIIASELPRGVRSSGACVVMARISTNGDIELWNAGDSRGVVIAQLSDGKLVTLMKTIDHSVDNESEIRRLMTEKYPDALKALPSDYSISDIRKAGCKCGLLSTDNAMLVNMVPLDTGRPRATLKPGFRVNFSSTEKGFQMSRSVGHLPLGVTGTNWDYYHVSAPMNAKIHVILSSDGLWDVEPQLDTLFRWCESGGESMMYSIAHRWVNEWDFEHPLGHSCSACWGRQANDAPIRTVQHGIKPDDISLALCSWETPRDKIVEPTEWSLESAVGVTIELQNSHMPEIR